MSTPFGEVDCDRASTQRPLDLIEHCGSFITIHNYIIDFVLLSAKDYLVAEGAQGAQGLFSTGLNIAGKTFH